MTQTFKAQVDSWVLETEARMLAVFKTAAESAVEDVIRRTPVDTGYARASWTVTLDHPLPMRGSQGDGYQAPPYSLAIAGSTLGQTVYLSAVANYMGYLEFGTRGRPGVGMVRLTAQRWNAIVNEAVSEVKAAVAANSRR